MVSRLNGLDQTAIRHVIAMAQALENETADMAAAQLAPVLAGNQEHPEMMRLQAGIPSLRGNHESAVRLSQRSLQQRPYEALYRRDGRAVSESGGA